jgi:hypothetical protein
MSSNPTCKQCKKTVYQTELISYDQQTWHKNCFRCLQCNCVVSLGGVAMISSDLYCKNCFKRIFKEKGTYNSFQERRGSQAAKPVVAHAANSPGLARRPSIGKCAVADCSIFRAAGKLYCARHSNMMREALAGDPSAVVAVRNEFTIDAGMESPREAHAASPSRSNSKQRMQRANSDGPTAAVSTRVASKANLSADFDGVDDGVASVSSGRLQHSDSRLSRYSSVLRPTTDEVNTHPAVARSPSDSRVNGHGQAPSAAARQGSLRALYGLQTQLINSPSVIATQGLPIGAALGSPSDLIVAELTAQIKALQWENAALRSDVDAMKQHMQEMSAQLNRVSERVFGN